MTHTKDRSPNRRTPRSIAHSEWLMKPYRSPFFTAVFLAALVLLLSIPAMAQDTEKPPEGINSGNYNIRQSAEFGYRWTGVGGSVPTYNTFLDLRDGPRLLDYSLNMRSLNHEGWLLDNLSFSNFGYGGDPNNVSRLRMYKNKWYNFNANFRRDYTYWDYNLLANPLNPFDPTSPAGGFTNAPAGFTTQIPFSPHDMGLVRRWSDYSLTILPQSRVRFRLGYLRNIQEGPAFTTIHEGTEALLLQNVKTTLNGYQFGVDFKMIPRTNISYDQFLQYYKGDTTTGLSSTPYTLLNGTPVAIGLPLNQVAGQPCAQIFNVAPNLGTVYAGCPVYTSYSKTLKPRTTIPIEQLSIQSSYFKNVDFSGRVSYGAMNMTDTGFSEVLSSSVSRTLQLLSGAAGPMSARRVSLTADGAVTVYVTDRLRLVDTFRFNNYRIPGSFTSLGITLFSQYPLLPAAPPPASQTTLNRPNPLLPLGIFDTTNCPSPFTANTCPQHSTSSPADLSAGVVITFLGQRVWYNTSQIEYDFTHRMGARVGFRYGNRVLSASDHDTVNYSGAGPGSVTIPGVGTINLTSLGEVYFPGAHTNGATLAFRGDCSATTTITCTPQANGSAIATGLVGDPSRSTDTRHEFSGLIGLWARPVDELRLNLDVELFSADEPFTRISPRNLQHYKGRLNWRPEEWITVGAAFNVLESRNNVTNINHLEHNRSWSFDLAMDPKPQYGFDVGLDYNDVFSSTNICYALTSNPSPTTICPSPNPVQGISIYRTKGYFGYGSLHFRPVNRLYIYMGTYMSRVTGGTSFLAPTAPPGPLQYIYYKPYAGFDVQIYQGLSWRTAYNFHDYKETSTPDLATPGRNFHANLVTLSLKYAF
jgi:hypothetical protein